MLKIRSTKLAQFDLAKYSLFAPTIRTELLAGITVALALIPESLAFAAIAGVNPMVALYTSFCMSVVIALAGGRIAMISAATGSMALLMTALVRQHGVEYLFAATILTGLLQILIGILKIDRFFSLIPKPVIAGFVNALAILIFAAQLKLLPQEPWSAYVMVAATLGIIYLFPRLTKAIPSPLVAIVTMTVVAMVTQLDIRRVGDIGEISRSLPSFHLPQISLSWETLMIILPYALPLAIVGLLESLLTATLVDEITETSSSKNREVHGQGIANIVTGLFGGMAGCGMVGQSIMNVRSGGRKRLSTWTAGAFLLFAICVLRDVVQQIPLAALIGVMMMVAAETFDWKSLQTFRRVSFIDATIMLFTVVITLVTHNLAWGVLAGVFLSGLLLSWQATQISIIASDDHQDQPKTYHVSGQLSYSTTHQFSRHFDYDADPQQVVIDFSYAQVCNQAAAQAIEQVMVQYQRLNKDVRLVGLNSQSHTVVRQSGILDCMIYSQAAPTFTVSDPIQVNSSPDAEILAESPEKI